jgi:hypothetical protein
MLQRFFHAWERRLASATTDRVVRPFDWGLDWIAEQATLRACENDPRAAATPPSPPVAGDSTNGAAAVLGSWISSVMTDTDAFFTPPPLAEYQLSDAPDGTSLVTFPSALTTPHVENNTVYCRYFPSRSRPNRSSAADLDEPRSGNDTPTRRPMNERYGDNTAPPQGSRAAVLVLPQWNADAGGHVGLCKLLNWAGLSALRLALPYHDQRMPPELHRADYIVSANVARTVQVCRQAVLDARRAVHWLAARGYDRIGILGTSLGSCLALLTTAHEPLIRAQALNHISPYFADVVWRGLSTLHVREGLDGYVELDVLRALWKPISPRWYLERVRHRRTLLVYARYDLSFPVDLSEDLVREFRHLGIPHEVSVLRCGHYSTGRAPFKFVDGWVLTRFLRKALSSDA